MARSKTNLVLTVILFNAACPAADGSVMRVHSTGEIQRVQTGSATGLADIFSDDLEAKNMVSKLLMLAKGEPSDELLTFVEKLKKEIQPWHDKSEAKLEEAIKDIKSCAGDMTKGMQEEEAKKEICSEKSSSHTKHREDENTKYDEKVTAEEEKDEKETKKTTTCNAFDAIALQVREATAAYVSGDVGSYLESVSQKFCDDLTPRYKKAKGECTTAKTEFNKAEGIYKTKTDAYKNQKTTSNTVQTQMDVECCEYAIATKDVCMSHDACYKNKVDAYEEMKKIIQAEEKVRKVEWRVYSRIECLLPVLGTNEADKIEECRVKTHNTDHLNITLPPIPAKSTCNKETAYPGTDAYHSTHFGSLPANAKGETVAQCTGMSKDGESVVDQYDEIGVDPKQTLNKCQGDCDEDNECVGSLLCWQRDGDAAGPPGCAGTMKGDWDYCFDPADKQLPAGTLWFENPAVNPKQPLNKCQGDCDNDNECVGSLLCWQRNGNAAGPPGCFGTMKGDWDYCYDPNQV